MKTLQTLIMKQSVYLETTIISYLAARPSRDLIVAGHQQITLEWWEKASPKFQCYVSEVVIEESEKGDAEVAKKRLNLISGFQILSVNEEIIKTASLFFERLKIPEKSRLDSFHLAIASWYKMDYLLSWNCKHIVSGSVRKTLNEIKDEVKIHIPIICTPEELMEI